MDSETTISKFKQQVRENRIHRNYERSVGAERAYPAFDSSVDFHERDMYQMIPEGFKKWVENREKVTGRKPSMLVLLGQVGILRELDIPGIAVALTDDRDKQTREVDFQNHRTLIEGDVLLYRNTFSHVRKAMEELGIKDIDLAIARGVQGGLWTTDSVDVNGKILAEIINLLSPNGGQFMMHSPNMRSETLKPALARLKQCPNLVTEEYMMRVLPSLVGGVKFTKLGGVDLEAFWKAGKPTT